MRYSSHSNSGESKGLWGYYNLTIPPSFQENSKCEIQQSNPVRFGCLGIYEHAANAFCRHSKHQFCSINKGLHNPPHRFGAVFQGFRTGSGYICILNFQMQMQGEDKGTHKQKMQQKHRKEILKSGTVSRKFQV